AGAWAGGQPGPFFSSLNSRSRCPGDPHFFGAADASGSNVRLGGVATHHSLAVEDGADLGDRLLHHPDPAGAVIVIKGKHGVPELLVKIRGVRRAVVP